MYSVDSETLFNNLRALVDFLYVTSLTRPNNVDLKHLEVVWVHNPIKRNPNPIFDGSKFACGNRFDQSQFTYANKHVIYPRNHNF